MTAADLLTDPEFLAFCSIWERGGRCPLVFADWLRDRGMDGQAGGAEWAATEPDRTCIGWKRNRGGVCPWPNGDGRYVFFQSNDVAPEYTLTDQIPRDVHAAWRAGIGKADGSNWDVQCRPTFPECIALFLDAWALARTPVNA